MSHPVLSLIDDAIADVPCTNIEPYFYTNPVGEVASHLHANTSEGTYPIGRVSTQAYACYLSTAAYYLPEYHAVMKSIIRYCQQYPTHPDDKKTREALAGVRHIIDRTLIEKGTE